MDFLKEHGSEVVNMLFTEFNMDDALRVRGEECFEEGLEKGLQGMIKTCQKLGASREDTLATIVSEVQLSEDEAEKYLQK